MVLNRDIAEQALENASKLNPGLWVEHSKYVAMACQNIASRCPHLSVYLICLQKTRNI